MWQMMRLQMYVMPLFDDDKTPAAEITKTTKDAIQKIIDVVTPIGLGLVVLAFIVIGLMFLVGGQRGKENAKDWIMRVVIGSAIIILAIVIANFLWGAFGSSEKF